MDAVEFVTEDDRSDPDRAAAVQQRAIDHGLLLLTCGTRGNVIRTIPPLVVTTEEIDFGLATFGTSLDAVSDTACRDDSRAAPATAPGGGANAAAAKRWRRPSKPYHASQRQRGNRGNHRRATRS